jgi:hypothetical protein
MSVWCHSQDSFPALINIEGEDLVLITVEQMDSITRAFIYGEAMREEIEILEREALLLEDMIRFKNKAIEAKDEVIEALERSVVFYRDGFKDLEIVIELKDEEISLIRKKNRRVKWLLSAAIITLTSGVVLGAVY